MFSSRAILAIGCELSMTILIASSRNSGENFLRCSGIGLLRSGLRSYWVPVRNLRGSPVSRGVSDLEAGEAPLGRARRGGGGRKRLSDLDPGLRPALLALVEPDERGDPMSALRWTTKSTRTLAAELTAQGHRVGADTVADLLRQEGFSLQANTKTIEGKQHPDRDAQFRYINEQVKDYQDSADPVISVDALCGISHKTVSRLGFLGACQPCQASCPQ